MANQTRIDMVMFRMKLAEVSNMLDTLYLIAIRNDSRTLAGILAGSKLSVDAVREALADAVSFDADDMGDLS